MASTRWPSLNWYVARPTPARTPVTVRMPEPPCVVRDWCPWCWGQRAIWEPGSLGLLPVRCPECFGTGRVL